MSSCKRHAIVWFGYPQSESEIYTETHPSQIIILMGKNIGDIQYTHLFDAVASLVLKA